MDPQKVINKINIMSVTNNCNELLGNIADTDYVGAGQLIGVNAKLPGCKYT
jgi:hypothetical protein